MDLEDKKIGRKWIEEVLEISGKLDDDLHKSLKSGVILCYLMLAIEERSIPRIQENTDHQFKLRENIRFFLDAVSDYGVPPHRMFQVGDLWNNTSMVNVVECVYSLAKKAEEKGHQIKLKETSPTEQGYSDAEIKARLSSEEIEDFKQQLSKLRGERKELNRPKVSAEIFRRKLAFLLGNKVDFEKIERGFVKVQALFRGHRARLKFKAMVRNFAYRDNVAKEILQTEKDYVLNLQTCINVYLAPLREAIGTKKEIVSASTVKAIFSDFEIICGVNVELLAALEPKVKNWHATQTLGDIFIRIMDFLKMYSNYIQNFNTSAEVISKCRKKTNFKKYLQDCKKNQSTRGLELPDYLIMPIQRPLRYNLLLRDLLKHTSTDHPDYEALLKASKKMADIADYLNVKKKEAENVAVLLELQSHLVGKDAPVLLEESRRLIAQEQFLDKKKLCILTLFNNALLMGRPRDKKTVEFKYLWKLEEVEIVQIDEQRFDLYQVGIKKPIATLCVIITNPPSRVPFIKEYNTLKENMEMKRLSARSDAQNNEIEEKQIPKNMEETTDIKGAELLLQHRKRMATLRTQSSNGKEENITSAKIETTESSQNEERRTNRDSIEAQLEGLKRVLASEKPTSRQYTFASRVFQDLQHMLEELDKEEGRKSLSVSTNSTATTRSETNTSPFSKQNENSFSHSNIEETRKMYFEMTEEKKQEKKVETKTIHEILEEEKKNEENNVQENSKTGTIGRTSKIAEKWKELQQKQEEEKLRLQKEKKTARRAEIQKILEQKNKGEE